ncbi:peptidylprolyl isomerase [Paenibacillus terrigena]|uniref:peptidylprolyl isomerase n=1 Tax=Paenibacillus terrigena TaxID=369333 RepID=UPI0003629EDD|nr:peptidylprolyl isomerase [Paenibacillus terrigena]
MQKPLNRWMLPLVVVLTTVLMLSACGGKNTVEEKPQPTPETQQSKSWKEAPAMAIDTNKKYTAKVSTSKGEFTIELFAKDAPITVNNFVFLAKEGFYNGITFHRIIESFMVQTGDPQGTGAGGPGYTIQDELGGPHKYEVGTVAMAKTRAPNSAGSQFFIGTGADIDSLNGTPNYPIFGKVSEGMDTVKKIAATPTELDDSGREKSKPMESVTIKSIEITEQ